MLLLLASATAGILLLFLKWPQRAMRVRAKRRARLLWTPRDAQFVVGATLLLLSGFVLSALSGEPAVPAEQPPHLAIVLLSACFMPVLTVLLCRYRAAAVGVSVRELLGIQLRTWKKDATLGLFAGVAILLPSLLLSYGSGILLQRLGIPPEMQDALRWFQDPEASVGLKAAILLQGGVIAPLVEEVLYRGVLLSVVLRGRSALSAVLLISLFFAAMHLQAQAFAPLLVVGAAFAAALLATGSLITPIVMHMVFNAGNLLLAAASPG